jgi:hypothetical protein
VDIGEVDAGWYFQLAPDGFEVDRVPQAAPPAIRAHDKSSVQGHIPEAKEEVNHRKEVCVRLTGNRGLSFNSCHGTTRFCVIGHSVVRRQQPGQGRERGVLRVGRRRAW